VAGFGLFQVIEQAVEYFVPLQWLYDRNVPVGEWAVSDSYGEAGRTSDCGNRDAAALSNSHSVRWRPAAPAAGICT
jgi:hypothetical protein